MSCRRKLSSSLASRQLPSKDDYENAPGPTARSYFPDIRLCSLTDDCESMKSGSLGNKEIQMKPSEWKKWNDNEKREYALALRSTFRGKLVMGKALAKAVMVMRKEELLEGSTLEDIEMLGLLYEPWFSYYLTESEMIAGLVELAEQNAEQG
jgi:hypothetical protein